MVVKTRVLFGMPAGCRQPNATKKISTERDPQTKLAGPAASFATKLAIERKRKPLVSRGVLTKGWIFCFLSECVLRAGPHLDGGRPGSPLHNSRPSLGLLRRVLSILGDGTRKDGKGSKISKIWIPKARGFSDVCQDAC